MSNDGAATRDIAILVALGLLVRLYFIYRYPAIFGGDTIARLAHTDHIVLGHQLPLLQLGIHYLSGISQDPLLIRWYMAVLGSVADVGFYVALTNLVSRGTAFDGALLFVTSPFILAHSVVPYQEILMLAGLAFAFHFAFVKRWPLASLSLGLACLTRYEAWLACPVLAFAYLRDAGVSAGGLLRAGAAFGWAPLAWILYGRGITPAGTHVLEAAVTLERFVRWAHLGATTLRNSPLPTLVLAGVGAWLSFRRRLFERESLRLLIAFLALFLAAIIFTAPGIGDDPGRIVTSREAHVLLAAVIVLAALGLEALPRWRHAATAMAAVVGLWMADRYIGRATAEPAVALSHRLARYLEREVPPGERVAILARATDVESYLADLEQARGAAAVAGSLRNIRRLDMTKPPDYQRVVVASRVGRDRLLSYATLRAGRFVTAEDSAADVQRVARVPPPQWIAVWSDFVPTNEREAGLAREAAAHRPREVLRQGGLAVDVYALRSPGP